MIIALGSSNAAKISAARAATARIASIDANWNEASIVSRDVVTDAPLMPLSDEEMMRGAMARAEAIRLRLSEEKTAADLYIGLEGGFHSHDLNGTKATFLRGWAYVTDGVRGSFGAGPSIQVPESIVKSVVDGARELAEVIDETAGEVDVRSRQGAWGVLSRDLFTRSMSFEVALIAAFARFYNHAFYASSRPA